MSIQKLYKDKKYEECILKCESKLTESSNHIKARLFYALSMAATGLHHKAYTVLLVLLCEMESFNYEQQQFVKKYYQECLEKITADIIPTKRHIIGGSKLPRNFSWLIPGRVAGSSMPTKKDQICGFKYYNISVVINLINKKKIDHTMYNNTDVTEKMHMIKNTFPPSIIQMDAIMEDMEKCISLDKAILIHCDGGRGRAGTVLTCFALKHGFKGKLNCDFHNEPNDANGTLEMARQIRPGTIENEQQKKFVTEYSSHLWKKYGEAVTHSGGIKYPSTPHLIYSPCIQEDDKVLVIDNIVEKDNIKIVITEKLDGQNCCIYNGKVYSRTHSKETKNPQFAVIKEMYHNRIIPMMEIHKVPVWYMIFGENMTATHGITYNKLESHFYVFSIFNPRKNIWLDWTEVKNISQKIDLPTVPELFVGVLSKLEIKNFITDVSNRPSKLSTNEVMPEGFVVRLYDRIHASQFKISTAKYVIKYYGLIDDEWTKSWKKATILDNSNDDNIEV